MPKVTVKFIYLACWCTLTVLPAAAERWRWPQEPDAAAASSVRIDTKVQFVDDGVRRAPRDRSSPSEPEQEDAAPFRAAADTQGFYNRPAGAGRYPVRVHAYQPPHAADVRPVYPVNSNGQTHSRNQYASDGTLDSFQYCKCISTPECGSRPDSERACGAGKYLCCYKKPSKNTPANSEYFNEIEDERLMMLPGREHIAGAFPSPDNEANGIFDGALPHDHVADNPHAGQPDVLIGPQGPTGQVGPPNKYLLVGPGGPTNTIGPVTARPVLSGPNGPTGIIGPADAGRLKGDIGQSESAQRGVLVGPGGPTGIIGPYNSYAQRPVLVGPGGPTGVVGPGRGGRHGVLTGPGGPTGIIGPGYGRQGQRGLLVGPGGPTGTIGPGRQLLVGPGGPTGVIGPRGYFGNYF